MFCVIAAYSVTSASLYAIVDTWPDSLVNGVERLQQCSHRHLLRLDFERMLAGTWNDHAPVDVVDYKVDSIRLCQRHAAFDEEAVFGRPTVMQDALEGMTERSILDSEYEVQDQVDGPVLSFFDLGSEATSCE